MDRRGFIRASCFGCAGIAIGANLLEGCSATMPLVKVESDGHVMRIPLTHFATNDKVIARTPQLPDDVLIIKHADGSFTSLYLRCTHRDQPLTATSTGLHCPSHGSRFAMDGSVQQGPADKPLRTFNTTADAANVIVDLRC